MNESDRIIARAQRSNKIIHDYVMAACHALLWIAALSFAAFFHLSTIFNHDQALLLSTLVAYGAYLSESILATVKTAAAAPPNPIYVRKMSLWKWIALNITVNATLSILYLLSPSMPYLIMIIFTAGWQKYIDGRIPSHLLATALQKPLNPFPSHAFPHSSLDNRNNCHGIIPDTPHLRRHHNIP